MVKILVAIQSLPLENSPLLLEKIDHSLDLLDELSAIQLAESKEIMSYAEKLYLVGKNSSQFVVALIVIILVVLQAIVFSSKTIIIKNPPKFPGLN